jgi:GT2 family glycosyltransferase
LLGLSMNAARRVSVIIPTFNSSAVVVEAIISVLAQTRAADEIIVVDDGSTDDTAERLAVFGERIKYIAKPNGGVSSARNRGVQEATGDCIAFLDADDVWHPRKLEIQLAILEAHPEMAMLGTRSFCWPTASMPEPAEAILKVESVAFEKLIIRNAFCTSTIVIRTDALRRAGEFDGTLQGPEDHDMWLRVASQAPVGFVDSKLIGYNVGTPNSLSKNAERMERDTLHVLAKQASVGAFRGRWLLHRRALGINALRAAYLYSQTGMLREALRRVAHSFFYWPMPFPRGEVKAYGARLRLAFSILRRYATKRTVDRKDVSQFQDVGMLST